MSLQKNCEICFQLSFGIVCQSCEKEAFNCLTEAEKKEICEMCETQYGLNQSYGTPEPFECSEQCIYFNPIIKHFDERRTTLKE